LRFTECVSRLIFNTTGTQHSIAGETLLFGGVGFGSLLDLFFGFFSFLESFNFFLDFVLFCFLFFGGLYEIGELELSSGSILHDL